MLIHLHITSGYFCATTGELSSCNREHMTHKAKYIFLLGPLLKKKKKSLLAHELGESLSVLYL